MYQEEKSILCPFIQGPYAEDEENARKKPYELGQSQNIIYDYKRLEATNYITIRNWLRTCQWWLEQKLTYE